MNKESRGLGESLLIRKRHPASHNHTRSLHHHRQERVLSIGLCFKRQSATFEDAIPRSPTYHWLDIGVRHSIEAVVLQLEIRPKVDISTLVLGRVAVLRSGEDGDAASVVLNLVPFHPDLVRSNDGLQAVLLTKPLGDVRSEL